MNMIKKLTKHGNSLAIIIDRAVLNLLKIDADTPLDISTDGQVLVISPVRDDAHRDKFKKALESTNRGSSISGFLSLNGFEIEADEEEFEKIILAVAEGKFHKAEVAEFFRKNHILDDA